MPMRTTVTLLAVSLLAIGLSQRPLTTQADASASGVAQFDADRAWQLVENQVATGQRPAGSQRLRRLARELRRRLPGGHFEPIPGEPRLRNVVGTIPGRRPGILIGAHYDTLVEP